MVYCIFLFVFKKGENIYKNLLYYIKYIFRMIYKKCNIYFFWEKYVVESREEDFIEYVVFIF